MEISSQYRPLWAAKYRYAVISGGRGSGKSVATQAFLRDLSYEAGHKIISTRYTMTSAEKSVVPEFAGKLAWDNSPYGGGTMEKDFELVGRTFSNLQSQSEVAFMGLKTSSGIQTASLKSIEGLTTWHLDEAEELPNDGTETEACTFDKVDDSIRKVGANLRTILVWNPSNEDSFVYQRFFKEPNVPIDFNGVKDGVLYIYTSYLDNLKNLHPSFAEKAERTKEANPARYDHIYLGIPIKENEAALWKKTTMLSPYRVSEYPLEMKRIVVAVDPSGSQAGSGDECGIIVAGEDFNGHYYILKDLSAQLSPSDWAKTAIGAFKEYEADQLIAEKNFGAALVDQTLASVDPNIPVTGVIAKRGKMLRAQPVASLYEMGRVHHVGQYPELEAEMTTYTGDDGQASPNRLDAAVYAVAALAFEQAPDINISFV